MKKMCVLLLALLCLPVVASAQCSSSHGVAVRVRVQSPRASSCASSRAACSSTVVMSYGVACSQSAGCSASAVAAGCSGGVAVSVRGSHGVLANMHARKSDHHQRIADRHAARAGTTVVFQSTAPMPAAPKKDEYKK